MNQDDHETRLNSAMLQVVVGLLGPLIARRQGSPESEGMANAYSVAKELADELSAAGLLADARFALVATVLRASDWAPAQRHAWLATVTGELLGVVMSGSERDVADFLRVREAQLVGGTARSIDDFLPLAARLKTAIA